MDIVSVFLQMMFTFSLLFIFSCFSLFPLPYIGLVNGKLYSQMRFF